MQAKFVDQVNLFDSIICCALWFDVHLTGKILSKRAIESLPRERSEDVEQLQPLYSGPDKLVFVVEASKDSMSVCAAKSVAILFFLPCTVRTCV